MEKIKDLKESLYSSLYTNGWLIGQLAFLLMTSFLKYIGG